MDLCDICKIEPAVIYVKGEGHFCLGCHNRKMAAQNGVDDAAFRYPAEASFTDKDGSLHFFHLTHMYIGSKIRWQAEEVGGDYEIVTLEEANESPQAQIGRFFQKIADTLWNRTMSEYHTPLGTVHSLEEHGNIDIRYSTEKGEVCFVIDGRQVSLEELGRMLETYEGFTLQYQIRDKSEDVVKEEELLMPLEFTKETLLTELRRAIYSYSDSRQIDDIQFVSYRRVPGLTDRICEIIDKLEYWYNHGSKEEAISCAEEMIDILNEEVETDDDMFPEYEIGLIEDFINENEI